ncbi:MAG: LPS export ABC transporter periplasmic protein LptC [Candidatus Omnitrophica bacterium]|nr:LPS export ABC transporter periplasmic protein LptC [Candidatus Omnitrophota bacterium]
MKTDSQVRIIAVACSALLISTSFSLADEGVSGGNDLSGMIEQEVSSFELSGYGPDGKREWQLKGESADISSDEVWLKSITANSYGENQDFTLEAASGIYDKKGKMIHLDDGVKAVTSDGTRIETTSCDWNSDTHQLHTPNEVAITTTGISTTGKGALIRPEDKSFSLKEDVIVKLEDGAVVITCDGSLELDYEKGIARFTENVCIDDESGQLIADKVDVVLDAHTKKMQQAVATGNVRVKDGKNWISAERAIYETETKKMTLTGRPRLIYYPSEEDKKKVR